MSSASNATENYLSSSRNCRPSLTPSTYDHRVFAQHLSQLPGSLAPSLDPTRRCHPPQSCRRAVLSFTRKLIDPYIQQLTRHIFKISRFEVRPLRPCAATQHVHVGPTFPKVQLSVTSPPWQSSGSLGQSDTYSVRYLSLLENSAIEVVGINPAPTNHRRGWVYPLPSESPYPRNIPFTGFCRRLT